MDTIKSIMEKLSKRRRDQRAKLHKLEYDKIKEYLYEIYNKKLRSGIASVQLTNFSRTAEEAKLDIQILSGADNIAN